MDRLALRSLVMHALHEIYDPGYGPNNLMCTVFLFYLDDKSNLINVASGYLLFGAQLVGVAGWVVGLEGVLAPELTT